MREKFFNPENGGNEKRLESFEKIEKLDTVVRTDPGQVAAE